MALVVKDRVKETTATTGTGTLTLAGAVAGFQTFTSVLSNGDTTYYGIFESSTGEFEVGLGTFTSSGTTLARTTILESSNSGSAINLTAGAADVFITQPAEKAVYLDASGYIATADGRNLTNVDADTVDSLHASSFIRSDANDTSSGTIAFGTGTLDPDSYTGYSGGFGTIADGSGWSARGVFLHGGATGQAAALAISGNTTYFGSQNGTAANTMATILSVPHSTNVVNFSQTPTVGTNVIWNAGNDGSGSGLDADTLDGVQGSSYLRSDANDTYTGLLSFGSTGTRIDGSDGFPLVQVNSSRAYFGSTSRSTTTLASNSSTGLKANVSGTDYTVWHAGNDGSGSGLDADTLDGVQGSSYLRSDADDSASGDITFTESIQIQSGGGSGNPIRIGSGFGSGGTATIHKYGAALYLQYANGQSSTDLFIGGGGTTANLRMQGGYIDGVEDIYLRDKLFHEGDTDTYLGFGTNTITLATGGSSEITVDTTGVRLGDTGNGYFQPVSGDYGSIQIDGGAHGSYEGYSIGGRAVFMHNNANATGIYDDVNNNWMFYGSHGDSTYMYYNGTQKLNTTSTGANIDGDLNAVDNIYMAYRMYHEGDTDTYLEFGTDAINLACGGGSSLYVVSTYISVYEPMYNYAIYYEDYDSLSGTSVTVNCDTAQAFSITLTGNTTFSFNSVSSAWSTGFIMEITGNGSTVTWPTSVDWAGGTAPDAPASGETDILVFWTRDGGTTWYGALAIDAAA